MKIDGTLLTEIYFEDDDLSKCLHVAADWVNNHEANYRIRKIFTEYNDEWNSWSVNILLYGVTDKVE